MQMPEVSKEQRRLTELFAGTWRGEETLHPSEWDPKGGAAFGTWIVQPSLDGFFLLVDYTEERDGKVVYRGHGVHAWDAGERSFFSYWFDNMGGVPKTANRATLDGSRYTYDTDDGPMGISRFAYSWSDGRFEFSIQRSKDGSSWKPMHEGRYTRVPTAL